MIWTSVAELSGRTVNYGYDNLYRLTNETIAADPAGMSGAVSYGYDAVGNRTQKVSTLPGYPGGLVNYNANDQLATDAYDNEGNTTASSGNGYVYDFENHLIQANGNTYAYDGDGIRVQKIVAGLGTNSLVDALNPTGYPQVLTETYFFRTSSSEISHQYVYGLERLSEVRNYAGGTQYLFYVYDGHGSVRALTDLSGTVTDTYDYDAFGNLINSTGTTYNNFLFAGEQFDPDLGLYYNRARYLNVSTGRFWTMDSYEGEDETPPSLHKYLYTESDPVDLGDPSGNEIDEVGSFAVMGTLDAMPSLNALQVIAGVAKNLREPCWMTGQQCRQSAIVKSAIEAAWLDSAPGIVSIPGLQPWPRSRTMHEEGGWIYQSSDGSNSLKVVRAAPGGINYTYLENPVAISGYTLIADFHTHPDPTGLPGPGPADRNAEKRRNVPGIIRATDGYHVYGPKRRGANPTDAEQGPVDGGFPGSLSDTRPCP
jgi:RHS repeat-associated protein